MSRRLLVCPNKEGRPITRISEEHCERHHAPEMVSFSGEEFLTLRRKRRALNKSKFSGLAYA